VRVDYGLGKSHRTLKIPQGTRGRDDIRVDRWKKLQNIFLHRQRVLYDVAEFGTESGAQRFRLLVPPSPLRSDDPSNRDHQRQGHNDRTRELLPFMQYMDRFVNHLQDHPKMNSMVPTICTSETPAVQTKLE
jgi:hypothetical protein